MLRALASLGKVILGLALVSGLLYAAFYFHRISQAEKASETSTDAPKRSSGNIVKLGAQLASSHGIKDEPVKMVAWQPSTTIYGRVVPNPHATFEIRTPFAGTLHSESVSSWPKVGIPIKSGQSFGHVELRVGLQERLDLQAKLTEARQKSQGALKVVQVIQARVDRLQKVTANEGISRRELDDAQVSLIEAQTQAATASANVELYQNALAVIEKKGATPPSSWRESLSSNMEGEVVEVLAQPGMHVDAGTVILRITDYSRPWFKLDFPSGLLQLSPPDTLEVILTASPTGALGQASDNNLQRPESIQASMAGIVSQVESALQMNSYYYQAKVTTSPEGIGQNRWRPGLFVKAEVQNREAKSEQLPSVPAGALLFHQGRALVYVTLSPGRYARKEVQLQGKQSGRWVIASGLSAYDVVVSQQAQVLLSEEFKSDMDD